MSEGARYRAYLLGVLLLALAFNGVDRLALGLLLQDIKADLGLSDTQLGFLNGMAFSLFYSVMGIPIARWADRGNRVRIIAITCLLWSAAVALCGSAANFTQLLLIRVGVAVGEAGLMPPANSLIADYFSRAERPRAVATYMLGGSLSTVIGYFLAGWLNDAYGWRLTFVFLGAPGLAVAGLAWLTLREPRRAGHAMHAGKHAPPGAAPGATGPRLQEVGKTLWRSATFRQLLFAFSVLYFCGVGIWQWVPTLFIRSYGLGTARLGTWYAMIWGLGGLLGTLSGGALASRYAPHDERLQLKAIAASCCLFGAIQAGLFLSRNSYLALSLMALAVTGGCMINGPLFATIQTLVPERMRAQSVAIVYLFANLIGMGLGPLAVGVLSDAMRSSFGEESLRYALLALCPAYVWGGWHLWRASRTVARDLSLVSQAQISRATNNNFIHCGSIR